MQSLTMPAATVVYAHLERILTSVPFSKSNRSQRFLRHVVENSLEERTESLKEFAIAIQVFDRDLSYDPAVDATVRVEAGRMRARLREYYVDSGRNDLLVIGIPKGAYRACFTDRCISSAEPAALIQSSVPEKKKAVKALPTPDEQLKIGPRPMHLGLAATVVFAAIVGGAMFLHDRLTH